MAELPHEPAEWPDALESGRSDELVLDMVLREPARARPTVEARMPSADEEDRCESLERRLASEDMRTVEKALGGGRDATVSVSTGAETCTTGAGTAAATTGEEAERRVEGQPMPRPRTLRLRSPRFFVRSLFACTGEVSGGLRAPTSKLLPETARTVSALPFFEAFSFFGLASFAGFSSFSFEPRTEPSLSCAQLEIVARLRIERMARTAIEPVFDASFAPGGTAGGGTRSPVLLPLGIIELARRIGGGVAMQPVLSPVGIIE
jgi:hypothetical protein